MNLLAAAKGMLKAYTSPCDFKLMNDEVVVIKNNVDYDSQDTAFILGSNEIRDWEYNADVIPKYYEGAFYHRGFLRSVMTLLPVIEKIKPSFLVGHSRGAAVASILSRLLKIPTIAFNSPRPLWLGERVIEIPCICVQAEADIICKVPPRLFGYQHAGTCIWFPGRSPALNDEHRMKWTIERLENSEFKNMAPFAVRHIADTLQDWDLPSVPRMADDNDG